MDKRESLSDRKEVPSICKMCVHACIQVYELKNGAKRTRIFCSHPKDSGAVLFKVLSCNLFELLVQKDPKTKS